MQKHHRLHLQIERLYCRGGGARFANYRIWKSSDYLLNAFNIDSATTGAASDIPVLGITAPLSTKVQSGGAIYIIGSQIKANGDVSLIADHNINLMAAENVDTLNAKNKGSSASIGVSFGTDGFLVTASASGNKGKTNGNGTTWTETTVQSGNHTGDTVTLNSGTDTNLIGAQVSGNQVIANVGTNPLTGGNLNIQSLQDTNQYKDKQQSIGGSISVGYGKMGGSVNYSASNTKSNYASVNEQSGIMAGDGGFQVNVNGNTDLKGAVIASTQAAIDNQQNSLTTQTLTVSNIENKAAYKADSMSMSAGVGTNKQTNGSFKNSPTASAGIASDSDKSSSVTVSAISGGTVSVTGQDSLTTLATLDRDVKVKQTTDAQGNITNTAVDSNGNNLAGTLTPIFDKEKVARELAAQVQITQAFSAVAPKAVADYAATQTRTYENAQSAKSTAQRVLNDPNSSEDNKAHAQDILNQADAVLNDPNQQAQYDNWKEGGIYRIALHTALGGLITGDISGAAAAGTIASTAPLLNNLQQAVTSKLIEAGASTDAANIISQALAELTSVGIGSAIGGTAGAGASLVVDTNNRALHQETVKAITDKAIQECGSDFKCASNLAVEMTKFACEIEKCSEADLTQLTQSAIGFVGSAAGTFVGVVEAVVGGGLVAAPEPTGVTKLAGAATLAVGVTTAGDSGYGVYSNAVNMYRSLGATDSYLPSSGLGWLANYFAPDNQTAQDAAAIASLSLALASGRVPVGTRIVGGGSALQGYSAANINEMLDLNAYKLTGAAKGVLIPTYDPVMSVTSKFLDTTQKAQLLGTYFDLGSRLLTLPSSGSSLLYLPYGYK